jgi:hypothetical protein
MATYDEPADQFDRRQLLFGVGGLLLPLRLTQLLKFAGCGSSHGRDGSTLHTLDEPEFRRRDHLFRPFGRDKPVYEAGSVDAPPVLVLHESPGMTSDDIDFAWRLAIRCRSAVSGSR